MRAGEKRRGPTLWASVRHIVFRKCPQSDKGRSLCFFLSVIVGARYDYCVMGKKIHDSFLWTVSYVNLSVWKESRKESGNMEKRGEKLRTAGKLTVSIIYWKISARIRFEAFQLSTITHAYVHPYMQFVWFSVCVLHNYLLCKVYQWLPGDNN